MAAGYGTRLRPYTLVKPKPLFPVLNRPLLHILLDKLQACKCSAIVVNCHHLAEQVKEAVEGYGKVNIQYEPDILGTGGALRKALDSLENKPILVMNGDIYHQIDIADLYRTHLNSSCGVTMAMHDYPRFNSVRVENGYVTGFEKSEHAGCRAFTGVHVVDPNVVESIPVNGFYHVIDLYEKLAARRQINVYDTNNAFWSDIGTPEDYLSLHEVLLCKGKGRSEWLIHKTAKVEEGVRLEGWGVVGSGVTIGRNALLRDTVIWENAKIKEGESFADTIITGRK